MRTNMHTTQPTRFDQWHSLWVALGHPMAFGWLRHSPFAQKYRPGHPKSMRWISDTFSQSDCDTCLLVSAERHGRMKFPIKSAAGKNVSVSQYNGDLRC